MHEWAWTAWIASRADPLPAKVVAAWQEDATVWREGRRFAVLSVDQLIEGVHFRRSWAPLDIIGAKAVRRAVSDVWVKGARPWGVWVALQLPPQASQAMARRLYAGVQREVRRMGAYVVGGDTSRATGWGLVMTVLGFTRRFVPRDGARPGDAVWLVGDVGWAGLGVVLLERWHRMRRPTPFSTHLDAALSREPWPRRLWTAVRRSVRALLTPRIPLHARSWLVRFAHAAVDISDGLLLDLWRLLQVSGVSVELDEQALPMPQSFRTLCERVGEDPRQILLEGGEDYAWLVTTAADAPPPPGRRCQRIGTIIDQTPPTVVLRTRNGQTTVLQPRGWDHFATAVPP